MPCGVCENWNVPMNICAKMEWLGSASSSFCGEVDYLPVSDLTTVNPCLPSKERMQHLFLSLSLVPLLLILFLG